MVLGAGEDEKGEEVPVVIGDQLLCDSASMKSLNVATVLCLQVYIQKCDVGLRGDRLPVAHTCFNVLDLPAYPSRTVLRDKLIMAITQTEGFHLV